jgi:hypothetical protein
VRSCSLNNHHHYEIVVVCYYNREDIAAVSVSRSSSEYVRVFNCLLTKPYYLIDRVSYICSS